MKNILSLIAIFVICITLLQYRVVNSGMKQGHAPLKVTEWDAFGYYMYLPAMAIYNDCKELKWLDSIDKKYAVTGGNGWQAMKVENGNYVFKYLGGVAIMQIPFFLVGHFVAKQSGYPPDGFSPPYQYALGFGIIFYSLLSLFILRRVLLRYFRDSTVALTLILLGLATNFIQYAAVDSGQSHAYLFVLYVLILYTTIKWHENPRMIWAALTGYIIGLAVMSRPTEAIMLFVPLLWNTHNKEVAQHKWQIVKQHRSHIICAAIAGLLGILPQLLYWKSVTGSFLFDVGSKWDFLNPHFRVLFGWEKGWFIYTPVTLLFIAGMFYIKKFPFRKSVLWFCLLNIYIIIAWSDWRYGGSYATRALVQSYPLFALPLAAFTERISTKKGRYVFYIVSAYLLFVNLFQIGQYNKTILHYNDMNRKYYSRIYLNPNPSPIDMSLLDNDEVVNDESKYQAIVLMQIEANKPVVFAANQTSPIAELPFNESGTNEQWLKIEGKIYAPHCLWQSYLHLELKTGDSVKHAQVRLFSPISRDSATNNYAYYVSVPQYFANAQMKVYLSSPSDFKGILEQIKITRLEK